MTVDVRPIRFTRMAPTALPLALADLHRALTPGTTLDITLPSAQPTDDDGGGGGGEWSTDLVVLGSGFADRPPPVRSRKSETHALTRLRTLPDIVGPDMVLLMVGLNPSLYAADRGVGFARPGNRFWPAMLAAGLVAADRDPRGALVDHGIGMTDLVKRATRAASELRADEYRAGFRRLEALVGWLRPRAVCVVGLAGWRAAVDRRATAGPQAAPLAGRPVYVMPNTSGLNAGARPDDFVAHLSAARNLADL